MGALIDAEQAERLRREGWNGPKGTKRLSEELHLLFTSDAPYNGDTINLTQNGGPVINIITDGSGPPITQGPPVRPGQPANPVTTPISGGGVPPADDVDQGDAGTFPAAIPLAGWGIIQGKVSSNTYSVNVYIQNPASAAPLATMNIEQRQIDSSEEIPAGTEVPVTLWTVLTGGGTGLRVVSGTMQVPVFLERT